MKALHIVGDRTVELREVPDPVPGPHDVILEIKASGLCGSDLHQYRATREAAAFSAQFVAGHEPAGVVSAVGSGVTPDQAVVGDRVMVHHYGGCNRCTACRSGWTQMCVTRPAEVYGNNADGAHAAYMKVPATTLVPLREELSFEAGAAIGCGTGTAWGGLERLGEVGGKTMAIMGQGPVGLSGTMLAAARGAHVIAVDLQAERLEQATAFGASATAQGSTGDTVAQIQELTHGRGVDLVLETSGSSAAATQALAALAPWGKVCFVGLGGVVQFPVLDYMRRQITILTSWSMSIVGQQQCADFVVERSLPIDDLFSHRWGLPQADEAYQEFDRQTSGKGVFVW